MNDLIKSPYKISLWEDEQVYLVADKDEEGNYDVNNRYEIKTIPSANQVILNKYVQEICLANIGSDIMNTPIRAFEPRFTRQVNGTNTLTFKVFYRYFDEDEEEFKTNPFISLLVNERKVKLLYEDKWYNLVIKQIQENSQDYTFTYTCQDLYLNELAKNGYDLIFDTELLNNMGTVTELGAAVLDGTDWQVDEANSDKILQTKNEALFTYQTQKEFTAKVLADYEYKLESASEGDEVKISAGSNIFIGYSFYTEGKEGDEVQFFFRPDGRYETDDDGNIINSPLYSAVIEGLWDGTNLRITSDYYGKTLVRSVRVYYVPEIEKFCYKYKRLVNGKEDGINYYAYMGSEFASFAEAENLIANATGFIVTDGWTDVILSTAIIKEKEVDETTGEEKEVEKIMPALLADFSVTSEIQNIGLHASKAILQNYEGFTEGDKYLFAIRTDSNTITGAHATLETTNIEEDNREPQEFFSCVELENEIDKRLKEKGYQVFELTVNKSFSYTQVAQSYLKFYIQGSGKVNIIDAKLFKKVYRKYETPEGTKKELIIPDLETVVETAIQDKYFFFNSDQLKSDKIITDTEDIVFSTICLEDEIDDYGYILADKPSFEKTTNITASKSNRFNLIQELCEAFECWAKFIIECNPNGGIKEEYILTTDTVAILGKKYYTHIGSSEADKDYQFAEFKAGQVYEKRKRKFVQFKEYIGVENFTGFRYGINLKSINRELNSNQIVTKLIVELNANEYAPDGFCTIQRSSHNPTGEAVIYNFKYYLNNGLLNKNELNTDLYDSINGIGFFTQLREINRANEPYIQELVEVSNVLTKALALYEYYVLRHKEAEAKRDQYIEDLQKALDDSGVSEDAGTIVAEKDKDGNYLYNDIIISLIRQRDSMKTLMNYYESEEEAIDPIVQKYKIWKQNLEKTLEVNETKTKQLNKEFFNKYSRYIQEGTWISEDFTDANLYYFAAQSVSNTSAFPQVQYTINVIDVSADEDYRNYKFNIGDKTYIEDVEFFGYVPDTKRPYQEEVVITEMVYNLDNPGDNTIKVKNYKTQFEDLFQRVAAATQSLQYAEGKYARASNAIKEDGTIDGSVLERTLNFNYCLADAISKEIAEGGEVITLQAVTDPNRIVKMSGLGIELSNTGGQDWRTAITADGINADVGVFGSLHTNNLRIYNGDDESFFWDANGITAYRVDDETGDTIYNQFVRMNQDGIFGYIGNSADRNLPVSIDKIKQDSVFSLSWNGLTLQGINGESYIKLATLATMNGIEGNPEFISFRTTKEDFNPDIDYYIKDINNGYIDILKVEDFFFNKQEDNTLKFKENKILYRDPYYEQFNTSNEVYDPKAKYYEINNLGKYRYVSHFDEEYFKIENDIPIGFIEDKILYKAPIYISLNTSEEDYNSEKIYYLKDDNGDYYDILNIKEDLLVYKNGEIYDFVNGKDLYKKAGYRSDLRKVIWAGKEQDNFIVYEDGTLFANNGHFSGTIEATSGTFSGTITASKLKGALECMEDSVIIGQELGIGKYATIDNPSAGNFYVDKKGNVTMKGDIDLEGSIYMEGSIDVEGAGRLGYVTGEDAAGIGTKGIGITNKGHEIKVTNSGVALYYGDKKYAVVTDQGFTFRHGDAAIKVEDHSPAVDGPRVCYSLDGETTWLDVGSGSGGVAVFG